MGKLLVRLQKQLKTEYKQDAEECLLIYNKLKEMSDGRIWESQWSPLVSTVFKDFPSDDRRFQLTPIGKVFLEGIKNQQL